MNSGHSESGRLMSCGKWARTGRMWHHQRNRGVSETKRKDHLNMKRRNEELVISRPQDLSFGTIRMQLLLSNTLIFLIGEGEWTITMILRYCGQQQLVRFIISD